MRRTLLNSIYQLKNAAHLKGQFMSGLNHITPVQSCERKYFSFVLLEIMLLYRRPVSITRGASRSSRTLRRDAVGVSMLQRGVILRRRTAAMRTVKSRGPDTPMLVSCAMRASALRTRWPTSPVRRGEREAAVKTI